MCTTCYHHEEYDRIVASRSSRLSFHVYHQTCFSLELRVFGDIHHSYVPKSRYVDKPVDYRNSVLIVCDIKVVTSSEPPQYTVNIIVPQGLNVIQIVTLYQGQQSLNSAPIVLRQRHLGPCLTTVPVTHLWAINRR